MRTTLAYVLMTAVRDRLFVALAVLLGMVAVVAIFVGDGVVAEPTASRVAYAALAARLVYVLGIVLFVCYQIRRIYESREIDVILSRPLSRTGFVVAYAAGFAAGTYAGIFVEGKLAVGLVSVRVIPGSSSTRWRTSWRCSLDRATIRRWRSPGPVIANTSSTSGIALSPATIASPLPWAISMVENASTS